MADSRQFSSANKDISVGSNKTPSQKLNPKELLGSLSKDVSKRWMVTFVVVGGLVLLATTLMPHGYTPPKRVAPEAVLDTTPKGLSSDKSWRTTTDAQLLDLQKQLAASNNAQQQTLARMDALTKAIAQRPVEPVQAAPTRGNVDLTLPPPPSPPASLATPPVPPKEMLTSTPPAAAPSAAPSAAPAADAPAVRAAARAFVADTPAPEAAAVDDSSMEQVVDNEHQGFLPAGSFADATLISGVEAFTGGTAQSQPQPVVVRIDQNAILPNAAHYQIKGCHVLASVYGDMSSERVFGRLATLTCVDVHDKLVLSEDVEGVLVDSDGKNGIRGTLVDRQGAKLARSLLAGFAQGVASAFGQAQSTVTQTALGATSTLVGTNAIRAGGYEGASTAANQLAQFYLKQAEATMPVIAVDAGRKVSVLFTKSKSLHFELTGRYRPDQKNKLTVEN
ncbi:TraB/VirB10 family protein [Paraburkholderia sp. EG287A]|uniref:TraB/VirB10 family protein n=1 Tax=Paraburkholderia sp. EG287A TaxID=3237012 RepID=UPI0034D34FA1